jgi:NADH dehydrogenase
MTDGKTYDLVILGAGYAGLMAALRIAGRRRRPQRIALVNERDGFVERVRLQEQLSHPVAPRIASLPALLAGRDIDFMRARIEALDADGRTLRLAQDDGVREIGFARAIYALGSRIDRDAVPGVAEHAYCLDPGEDARSVAALRARLDAAGQHSLRVLVIGGGTTATEVAGEIKDGWPQAAVTMICRTRCGDFKKGERLAAITRAELERRGIALLDGTIVAEIDAAGVTTASGNRIAGDVCVWAGGLRAAPLARMAGMATDRQDRIWVDPMLRSISHSHIVVIGDAARPIAPTGAPYRLSAYSAVVSGAYAADALLAWQSGRRPRPFAFSTIGQGVAIGKGGLGFPTYRNDRQALFILRGRLALDVRNLFVWFLLGLLRIERRWPGFFQWPGRRRISWARAEAAMHAAAADQGRHGATGSPSQSAAEPASHASPRGSAPVSISRSIVSRISCG